MATDVVYPTQDVNDYLDVSINPTGFQFGRDAGNYVMIDAGNLDTFGRDDNGYLVFVGEAIRSHRGGLRFAPSRSLGVARIG